MLILLAPPNFGCYVFFQDPILHSWAKVGGSIYAHYQYVYIIRKTIPRFPFQYLKFSLYIIYFFFRLCHKANLVPPPYQLPSSLISPGVVSIRGLFFFPFTIGDPTIGLHWYGLVRSDMTVGTPYWPKTSVMI